MKSKLLFTLLITAMVMVACGAPAVIPSPELQATALPTQPPTQPPTQAPTLTAPPTEAPTQAAAQAETATPVPGATFALVPTDASAPVATAAQVYTGCTDSAAFVSDVTIPDNSVLAANVAFTKTWRLRNTGTCTWDSTYLVAWISGATMSQQPGYWIVPQGQTVAPGETVDVSVGMTSPPENGSYTAYWGLKRQYGSLMPIQHGANGNSFYVKIKVTDGTSTGNVTAASIDIQPEQGSGPACTADSTYFVHANITTDGPTTVAYEIDSSAGQIAAGYYETSSGARYESVTGALGFDTAGTKTINLRFVGPYPYPSDITVLLWVNRGEWYQAKLVC